ncbi:hypothetical protein HDV02_001729 [Globomyces sp. JEL0801]|nr:hypothetical protein HDV02_001729 [Globomyces sp. JEL0801]
MEFNRAISQQFIINPPEEEFHSEPCLAWQPDDTITGLPSSSRFNTLVNAVLQLICALPELNQELPLDSPSPLVRLFSSTVYDLHLGSVRTELTEELQKECVNRDVNGVLSFVLETILLTTRFGHRFNLEPVHQIRGCIFLNMESLTVKNTTLIALLNNLFGMPSLFFGGTPLPSLAEPFTKITSLPHFLIVLFYRGKPENLNTTSVELPMEMDMGKYLAENAQKPSKSHFYKGSATFYRLHGFLTQKDLNFMTYTRLRSGKKWFRAQDKQVDQVDLGHRIESQGLAVAIYRLQD